jgi:hypothetical protein
VADIDRVATTVGRRKLVHVTGRHYLAVTAIRWSALTEQFRVLAN